MAIREDKQQFLFGCVSSIVKIWDLPTHSVIGSICNANNDPDTLAMVSSIGFYNSEDGGLLR